MIAKHLIFGAMLMITAGCYHGHENRAVLRQSPIVKEMQTCRFPNKNIEILMREMVDMLEGDGYVITSANHHMGIIAAEKDVDSENKLNSLASVVMQKNYNVWKKRTTIKLALNFYSRQDSTQVRVIIQKRAYDNLGRLIESKNVRDPDVYHTFFVKFRKELYRKRLY